MDAGFDEEEARLLANISCDTGGCREPTIGDKIRYGMHWLAAKIK